MVLLLPSFAPLWIWLILTWCCWNLPSLCLLCGQTTKVSFTYQTQKRGLSSAWSMAKDSKCSTYIIGYYGWQGWTHGCPCDLLVWLPFLLEVLDVKHNPINWNTVVMGWFNHLVCRPLLILPQPPAWLHQLVFASTSTMRLESLSSVALILSTKWAMWEVILS